MNRQKGFSVLPVIALVLVIAVVGVVAWRVLGVQKTNNASTTQSTQQATGAAAIPDNLKTKQDVEEVQQSLDAATVESDLDTSGIDDDLNSLL